MIERVIDALEPVTTTVAIIANDARYLKLGLPVYYDQAPGIGPIEAIRTAIDSSSTEFSILVACDLPFVTSPLLSHLLGRAAGCDVVVPLDPEGREEPLCAVYRRSARPAVADLIRSGRLKISNLFGLVRTLVIPFHEIEHLAGSRHFFHNVNTVEDYERALEVVRSMKQ